MTLPTFKPVGDQLQEQAIFENPEHKNYYGPWTDIDEYRSDKKAYDEEQASLRRYTIRPSDWEGITEVNEGEFEVKKEVVGPEDKWIDASDWLYANIKPEYRRLLAVPLRPAGKGQEDVRAQVIQCISRLGKGASVGPLSGMIADKLLSEFNIQKK